MSFSQRVQGLVRLTKRDFWGLFHEAWKLAFSTKNVQSELEKKGGIYPFNPQRLLFTFVLPQEASQSSSKKAQNTKLFMRDTSNV
jgi:hypothetical protein